MTTATRSAAPAAAWSRLRLREFELLLAIHASRSVTAGARKLGLTQPAASRALRDIEQLLRVHLFERDRSDGMKLTGAGELVIARARGLLADVASMDADLAAFKVGRGGHLRLGVIPFVPGAFVERLIARLVGPPLAMTISVTEGSTSQLMAQLQLQKLDAIIGRWTSDALPVGLTRETLLRQHACLLAHPGNPLLRQRRPGLRDLAPYRWILPPAGTPTRTAINDAFARANVPPPVPCVEASSTRIIEQLVARHADMLSLVPADVGADIERHARIRRLEFPAPLPMPPVALVWATRHRDAPTVANLRESLREVVRATAVEGSASPPASDERLFDASEIAKRRKRQPTRTRRQA